jgi:hypothetical protein
MVKLYNMGIKGKIWRWNLQLSPLVPFIRSSIKRLNRVGDITEPCGRPILVSNSSPKKSPSMHLAVLPERKLLIHLQILPLIPHKFNLHYVQTNGASNPGKAGSIYRGEQTYRSNPRRV